MTRVTGIPRRLRLGLLASVAACVAGCFTLDWNLAPLAAPVEASVEPPVDGEPATDAAVPDGLSPPIDAAPPPGCDNIADPGSYPLCVTEESGLFVSAAAPTEGNGTKASPYKTLTVALAKALAGRRARLFVCAGQYPESLTFPAAISVHGGFSCANGAWAYEPSTSKVEISSAPAAPAPALTLRQLGGEVFLTDLWVVGSDNPPDEKPSVAALVASSTKVTFTRVTLEARAGGDVKTGAPAVFTFGGGAPGGNATSSVAGRGGFSGACAGGGSSTGGNGGDYGNAGGNGLPPGLGGRGGGTGCVGNPNGKSAPAGDAGASAIVRGVVTVDGWVGKRGDDGQHGGPGGGGGGGNGYNGVLEDRGYGGGGGAGGCGGAGGRGGGAGGASIALVVFETEVVLSASRLLVGQPKSGGHGLMGQAGETGSRGGFRFQNRACSGGAGGNGGAGGPGGGGAGGISAGIVWHGASEPVRANGTKIEPFTGPPTAGGTGVSPGISGENTDIRQY